MDCMSLVARSTSRRSRPAESIQIPRYRSFQTSGSFTNGISRVSASKNITSSSTPLTQLLYMTVSSSFSFWSLDFKVPTSSSETLTTRFTEASGP
ncbi:hypothetical protein OGAPHI_004345 [Ogataea philodendri]|uniref:Uncharacterized protein n=1 Tax=Ogataea philodendri TaxID=1378263 RepID=A0A9P8T5P7_9ASCO|nr:uncharacterized protein OGAPHI_004345 [Ogataea philodendri]KAH3666156.1 hypothetical protein OGAPHI_004345 [Ogataea philodendri]